MPARLDRSRGSCSCATIPAWASMQLCALLFTAKPTQSEVSAMRAVLACMSLTACVLVSACSSEQIYAAGQAHRRVECSKIENAQERERCMKQASISYEMYKQEGERK